MQYNYSKLLGRMREFGITQKKLACAIGKNPTTINEKLKGKSFTTDEMDRICKTLDIPNEKIGEYFFCRKGLENQTQSTSPN